MRLTSKSAPGSSAQTFSQHYDKPIQKGNLGSKSWTYIQNPLSFKTREATTYQYVRK